VDFPAPLGPEMTMGWWEESADLEGSVGAILGVWWVNVRRGGLYALLKVAVVVRFGSEE
jgi:hypothetical protein